MYTRRCTKSGHEELKRESQWPKLPVVGVWHLDDIALELRNCDACHSTLAKKVEQ
jgi:hypothetical protein